MFMIEWGGNGASWVILPDIYKGIRFYGKSREKQLQLVQIINVVDNVWGLSSYMSQSIVDLLWHIVFADRIFKSNDESVVSVGQPKTWIFLINFVSIFNMSWAQTLELVAFSIFVNTDVPGESGHKHFTSALVVKAIELGNVSNGWYPCDSPLLLTWYRLEKNSPLV